MKRYIQAMAFSIASIGIAGLAQADPFQWSAPHGMLRVEVDNNNKIFSNTGLFGFENQVSTNAVGQTVLAHNVRQFDSDLGLTPLGGIADRGALPDANNIAGIAATANSTLLVTDDPGFLSESLPEDQLMRVNFHNSLRFFNGTSWTSPQNGEELTVFDLSGSDETGGPGANLQVVLTGSGSDLQGTINIGVSPGGGEEIHGHLGYALERGDGSNLPPTVGAYMMELTLSALDVSVGGTGLQLQDSDPIFVIFNNQLDGSGFDAAVAGAQALPEPSTIMMVVIGAGLIGLRKRGHMS